MEGMESVRAQVADMKEHNRKLYGEIELLQKEKENNAKLEQLVQQLTAECGKGKDDLMIAQLKVQEMQFQVQDLHEQVR